MVMISGTPGWGICTLGGSCAGAASDSDDIRPTVASASTLFLLMGPPRERRCSSSISCGAASLNFQVIFQKRTDSCTPRARRVTIGATLSVAPRRESPSIGRLFTRTTVRPTM